VITLRSAAKRRSFALSIGPLLSGPIATVTNSNETPDFSLFYTLVRQRLFSAGMNPTLSFPTTVRQHGRIFHAA